MQIKIGFIALVLILFASCHHPDTSIKITEVKYGTYFGECWGYCAHDLMLTDGSSNSHHHWYGGAPDRMCTETYSHWQSLTESIDFDEFQQLNEVIGCPDCADGGAEWIEITTDGGTHKITFEYFNEPNETNAYIQELRDQMEVMKEVCL